MKPIVAAASAAAAMGLLGALQSVPLAQAATVTATTHASDVALSCPPGSDQRTPAEKQVKPGVVVEDQYGDYSEDTVNSDGTLQAIYVNSIPSATTPIVAVWQNGADCYGLDDRQAWAVTPGGQIYTGNDGNPPPANNYGDMAGQHLNQPIVGMSPTSTGLGYWLVASDGGIFDFGDAAFHGSLGNIKLNRPIVGMSVTPDGSGYWMVATDGGIFQFGDAPFYGSLGNIRLNKPIIGMVSTPDGGGYWMVASDGGVFDFGDATFHGSTGNRQLSAPIAGLVPNGSGYTLIGEDGQTYPFP